MHSDKVSNYVLDLLQQVPSVYVHGLGRFDAIFHSAVIDVEQSQIKPPYLQADFVSENVSESDILPAYMHYVSGMDINEAKEAISAFAEEILRHTETGDSYNLEKFGTFSKSGLNILHFTPDWDAFNLSFRGLQIIDMHPVQEIKLFEGNPAPTVILSEISKPIPEPVVANFRESDLMSDGLSDEKSSEIKPEAIPSEHSEISESTSRLAWIILSSALLLITLLCAFIAWDIISDRKRINQVSQINQDTLMITNEFDIPVLMDTLNAREDSAPVSQPIEQPPVNDQPVVKEDEGPPCFVVVGAFRDQRNVATMMLRLEGLGYKSAKIEGGALTRVAISSACDKTILQKILDEARSGINPDSWIY